MYYADGSKYDGKWKSDKRHGIGKMTDKHGQVTSGLWHMGLESSTTPRTYYTPQKSIHRTKSFTSYDFSSD
jgi:hypothetical protein